MRYNTMKNLGLIIAAALLALLGTATAQAQGVNTGYRLAAGDTIKIDVFKVPQLSIEVRISDKGLISYPFLGDLTVAGQTTAEVRQVIADGLRGDYILEPRVTVDINQYRPFYVNGEVRDPGGFPWEPGLTVRKALTIAGDLTERASTRKIFLQREGAPASARERVQLDDLVGPGDVLTVEQSFF